MSGYPESNFPAFHAAASLLRSVGHEVVNPAELNPVGLDTPPDDAPPAVLKRYWQACLRVDIRALCDCEGIVLMDGWLDSSGACLEQHVAHRLGLHSMTMEQAIAAGLSRNGALVDPVAVGGGD